MTRVTTGHSSQIPINHMTFEIQTEITARAMQTQQDFDTSLFVRDLTDATEQIAFS